MNIATESLGDLVSELQSIKWLLVVLVGIFLCAISFFFLVLARFASPRSAFGKELYRRRRHREVEGLLAKGDALAAKFAALEWISNEPGELYAHWFLARAYDKLNAPIEAKKTLTHLLTMAPDWEKAIAPWFERIEQELTPKIVK